jgi:hypothetical protein
MDLEHHSPSPKKYFGSFFNSLLKTITINIDNEILEEKVTWLLRHFEGEGLEITSSEDLDDPDPRKASRLRVISSMKIEIRRSDGSEFSLCPVKRPSGKQDWPGIESGLSREQILDAVQESRQSG